jgi:hypothetical protein
VPIASQEAAVLNSIRREIGSAWLEFGGIVKIRLLVFKDDPANGVSEILCGGITHPLWNYTNLANDSARSGVVSNGRARG